ncbi:MAG: TIGR04086 family membrane protein [Desulfotomaculaceae bacterium]|nr:TIGR04086 family membrane protein [Desulfotomaculaceae bacterium]
MINLKNFTLMRWTTEEKSLVRRIKPVAIMSGLAWACSATLGACILMYAWVVLSVSPVYYLGALVIAGTALGALAGGIAAGRAARTLGLLHGFLVGLCYGLLLLALFTLGSQASFAPAEIMARELLLGITGALGGLLGINIQYMVSRRPAVRVGRKFLQKDLLFPRRNQ